MKYGTIVLACLFAGCASAASLKSEGGHTVQLSTGEVVKVAFNDSFDVDPATRKPAAGGSSNVLFESSAGTRVAMRSRHSASRKTDTTIWSLDSPDRISFETDLEFRRKGLPVPLTIEINGERTSFLVDTNTSGEDQKVRRKLAPQIAGLSPNLKTALKELIHLGRAAYPHAGGGWIDLLYLFNPSEVGAAPEIVSSHEMDAEQREHFVRGFSPR
jgi:hypothetical protein